MKSRTDNQVKNSEVLSTVSIYHQQPPHGSATRRPPPPGPRRRPATGIGLDSLPVGTVSHARLPDDGLDEPGVRCALMD
eukprot:4843945-Pyramimonas_sp.AAC.1